MNCAEYIKKEFIEEYLLERENITDRILEAEYNMIFSETAVSKCEPYIKQNKHDESGVLFVMRRTYISIVWELILQIKAYVDDNDKDVLTIDKFKNNIMKKYLVDEKREEVENGLARLRWKTDKKQRMEYMKTISKYRNEIVAHNFKESPEMSMDIRWLRLIIDESIELLEYLYFGDNDFQRRLADVHNEKREFIENFLNRIYK